MLTMGFKTRLQIYRYKRSHNVTEENLNITMHLVFLVEDHHQLRDAKRSDGLQDFAFDNVYFLLGIFMFAKIRSSPSIHKHIYMTLLVIPHFHEQGSEKKLIFSGQQLKVGQIYT